MSSQITSTGYIPRDSVQLFYEREGNNQEGRTILFVHGLGGTTNAYQPLVSELQDFDIVRFDWSGHGRSTVPPSETSIELYVADCEAIIDHLGLADIVVYSGKWIITFKGVMLMYIQGVVVFGPVKPPPEAGRTALATRAATVRQRGMVAVTDTILSNAFSSKSLTSRKAEVSLAREMLTRQAPEGYAMAVDALARSIAPAWSHIKARVFILSGEEDKVSTVVAGSEIMREIGSNAQQRVWEDVGHWHMLENPDGCIESIRSVAGLKL
ncbi:putative alpha beta hydrolase fold protein [Eutypa lata UCREL1]|uniref:Putative alpha beta hydrolase fold protein n=1 Tax=Eutypa lata (strain UCR-EL1) TaxID=1287681 RepID=M7TS80_EUTLA|nr:putative alpha beta hydrolase fold protein [Eutypa lata UCREL1]